MKMHIRLDWDGKAAISSIELDKFPKQIEAFQSPFADEINSALSRLQPKPPIGLKPRHIVDRERWDELCAAVGRYNDAGLPIPADWTRESDDLCSRYKYSGVFWEST